MTSIPATTPIPGSPIIVQGLYVQAVLNCFRRPFGSTGTYSSCDKRTRLDLLQWPIDRQRFSSFSPNPWPRRPTETWKVVQLVLHLRHLLISIPLPSEPPTPGWSSQYRAEAVTFLQTVHDTFLQYQPLLSDNFRHFYSRHVVLDFTQTLLVFLGNRNAFIEPPVRALLNPIITYFPPWPCNPTTLQL